MEAAEKIYIHPDIGGREFTRTWSKRRVSQDSVEYTRTDAFFNKASIWFNNNLGHDECGVISYSFDTEEEMFKDFIEYMKGE